MGKFNIANYGNTPHRKKAAAILLDLLYFIFDIKAASDTIIMMDDIDRFACRRKTKTETIDV